MGHKPRPKGEFSRRIAVNYITVAMRTDIHNCLFYVHTDRQNVDAIEMMSMTIDSISYVFIALSYITYIFPYSLQPAIGEEYLDA